MKNALLLAAEVILGCSLALGQHGRVLHSFSGPDGFMPGANLIADSAGNLYGTTYEGGTAVEPYCGNECGVVFELSRAEGGVTEKVLYNFCSVANCADGVNPVGTLTFDSSGNLYGMTQNGGQQKGCADSTGCGVVFELTPNPEGLWTETVLHSFTGAEDDGENPAGGLTFDSVGNLYGTAGSASHGLVFELSPLPDGTWQETVLYAFTGGEDGADPSTGLVFDSSGNLYGATVRGGSQNAFCAGWGGCGVVFELTPGEGGSWQETVLHTFTGAADGADGAFPFAALTIDSSGDLLGTTANGGNANCTYGCGTAFELIPGNPWTEEILHSFNGNDGSGPWGNLTIGLKGNLYGTTIYGGHNEKGVVFELVPTRNGGWSEKGVSFGGTFGSRPQAGLTLGSSGRIFGTTSVGGSGRGGTVFEITK